MQNLLPTIIIGILILVLAVIFIIRRKKYGYTPKYKTFFIIGITWIPLGIATKNWVFTFVGLSFMIIGVKNKNRWKDEKKWSELSPEVRRMKLIIMTIMTLLLIAGVVTYFIVRSNS